MLELILFLMFIGVIFFNLILGGIIYYHFKRFGLDDDFENKKILKIFIFGGLILISLNFIFLILNFI